MSSETIDKNQTSNGNLLTEYEEKLALAVLNYKTVSKKLEFAFDSYDEDCIKEEMSTFRDEVKSWRKKIDELEVVSDVL